MFQVKRVYEPPQPSDGPRVLVDRLWPRGCSKQALALEDWAKVVAPSDALRRWYGHAPERAAEFRARYLAELAAPEIREALMALATRGKRAPVTLVTATKYPDQSHVSVLLEALERILA